MTLSSDTDSMLYLSQQGWSQKGSCQPCDGRPYEDAEHPNNSDGFCPSCVVMSMLLVYMGQLQRGCCQSGLDAALQDTPVAAAWPMRGNNPHANANGFL